MAGCIVNAEYAAELIPQHDEIFVNVYIGREPGTVSYGLKHLSRDDAEEFVYRRVVKGKKKPEIVEGYKPLYRIRVKDNRPLKPKRAK